MASPAQRSPVLGGSGTGLSVVGAVPRRAPGPVMAPRVATSVREKAAVPRMRSVPLALPNADIREVGEAPSQ